jgi:hypothetical protein
MFRRGQVLKDKIVTYSLFKIRPAEALDWGWGIDSHHKVLVVCGSVNNVLLITKMSKGQ